MSTSYITEPRIKYNDFIEKVKDIQILEPEKKVFISDHKILLYNGTYIYTVKGHDGNLELCRFGVNNIHKVFPELIRQFGFKIIDEYGMEFPECI